MPTFTKGDTAAEERSAKSRTFAGRIPYLGSSIGNKKKPTFFRMFHDKGDWLTLDVHANTPTKPAPEGFKGNWPASMSAICANDPAFRLRDKSGNLLEGFEPPTDHYGHCYIHESMADIKNQWGRSVARPATTHFALVVLREPVRGADGQITGFMDKMEEFTDKDGKSHSVPAFRLASQKWSNFFGPVQSAAYVSGTCCQTDFMVSKEGTEVEVSALQTTPNHAPGAPTWKVYTDALELMGYDMTDFLVEQSSKEHYNRFFNTGVVTPPEPGDSATAESEAPDSVPVTDDTEAAIEAFKNRMATPSAGTQAGP